MAPRIVMAFIIICGVVLSDLNLVLEPFFVYGVWLTIYWCGVNLVVERV